MSDAATTKPSPLQQAAGALALAVVSIGGGYGLRGAMPDQEPAVLAAAISSMRDDLREVRDDLREVREDLGEARDDRWTRTMMQQWLASEYTPLRDSVSDHHRSEGHQSGMHQIREIREDLRTLTARVRQLEDR